MSDIRQRRGRDRGAEPARTFSARQGLASAAQPGCQRQNLPGPPTFFEFLEFLLSQDDTTDRAERLLWPVLVAVVVTMLCVAGVAALVVTVAPWWIVASVLGTTAAGGVGIVARRWRQRRAAQLPTPPPNFKSPNAP